MVDNMVSNDLTMLERDTWLREEGFVVLRFWDHEVLKKIESVKQVFGRHKAPPLQFSPEAGAKRR